MKTYWFLPNMLNRKYSKLEKIKVWLFGDCYADSLGVVRFRDYAIYRKFNDLGYCTKNPYVFDDKFFVYEKIRFEQQGFYFKDQKIKRLFAIQQRENKLYKSPKRK